MSTLHRHRADQARRSRNTQLALYRNELRTATRSRASALAQADRAAERIKQLLPGALQAGMQVVEAAEITGVSRATLYRMLAEARRQQDLRGLAAQFERALEQLQQEIDHPPLPADFQRLFDISLDEVFELLMQLYDPLSAETEALGPIALTILGDLIPGLGTPEKIVLNMLLFQRLPAEEVGRSTQLSPTRVLAWAALGLLRLRPELRARAGVDGR